MEASGPAGVRPRETAIADRERGRVSPGAALALGRIDRIGLLVAAILAAAAFAPLVTYRANRIVAGEPRSIVEALPPVWAAGLLAVIALAAVVAVTVAAPRWRLVAAALTLVALATAVGAAAVHVTPPDIPYARVSLATGFWIALLGLALFAADALTRLRLGPVGRVSALAVAAGAVAILLASGAWDGLSLLKEYAGRADVFWREAGRHLALAVGSLAAAVVLGLPLGILCHRVPRLRAGVIGSLNIVQTIPSIALFGILIAPLGWLALNVPAAAALGIRGIGAAPAFVALVLYALLPVVANTVVGLAGVPRAAVDAARGMGMTPAQRLGRVELPLALPVILTAVRIVLVQNIGIATVAALIGGGGFGVFVFQGIGQTAMDLVLLGALPTVILAFAAAVILDAAVEAVREGRP